MKKIFLLFAALCCIMVANAQQFEDANGIKYNVTSTENNTVEVISKVDQQHQQYYEGDIVIPATVTNNEVTYSVTSIGSDAFSECSGLTSITLPSSLNSIGMTAFYGCVQLTSITIPASVRSITNGAFYGCILLSSISVEEGNPVYDSPDNCNAVIEKATNTLVVGCKNTVIPSSVTAIADAAFSGCLNLISITIPSSVTSIGIDAFYHCQNLTSITIPSSVTSIGEYAFYGCSGLTSITVLALTPPTLGENAFNNVTTTIPVYVLNAATYSSVTWGGFTNFIVPIEIIKQDAIAAINAAKEGVSLTAEETAAISGHITTIENVETMSDENLTIIENAKNAALAVISQAIIRNARNAAIEAIEAAIQGQTSAYITDLAQQYIGIINTATDVTAINNAKETALEVLNAAMGAYQAGKAEALGEMAEPCDDCPAVEVTKGTTTIRLYNPDKVEFK